MIERTWYPLTMCIYVYVQMDGQTDETNVQMPLREKLELPGTFLSEEVLPWLC